MKVHTLSVALCLTLVCVLGVLLRDVHSVRAALSCDVRAAASCVSPSLVILRMSSSTNAHAATGTNSSYSSSVVCCASQSPLVRECAGASSTVLALSSSTNAHASVSVDASHPVGICARAGSATVSFQASTSCSSFDTMVMSISSSADGHVGGASAYPLKICGTEIPVTLRFTISTTSASFGTIYPGVITYAQGTNGTTTESAAYSLTVVTNSNLTYYVDYLGNTLTNTASSSYTVPAKTPAGSLLTTVSEWGLKMVVAKAVNASGTLISPYASTSYVFVPATSTFSALYVGGSANGLDATSTINVYAGASAKVDIAAGSYISDQQYRVYTSY